MDLDLLAAIEALNSADPDELAFALESVRQQKQFSLSQQLMAQRHEAEEAIDRANNPGLAGFYDALAAARLEGIRSVWNQ